MLMFLFNYCTWLLEYHLDIQTYSIVFTYYYIKNYITLYKISIKLLQFIFTLIKQYSVVNVFFQFNATEFNKIF